VFKDCQVAATIASVVSYPLQARSITRLRARWLREPTQETVVDCAAWGESAGEPWPKAAIGCNRLQFSITPQFHGGTFWELNVPQRIMGAC
jgi:hypothetical protein